MVVGITTSLSICLPPLKTPRVSFSICVPVTPHAVGSSFSPPPPFRPRGWLVEGCEPVHCLEYTWNGPIPACSLVGGHSWRRLAGYLVFSSHGTAITTCALVELHSRTRIPTCMTA